MTFDFFSLIINDYFNGSQVRNSKYKITKLKNYPTQYAVNNRDEPWYLGPFSICADASWFILIVKVPCDQRGLK